MDTLIPAFLRRQRNRRRLTLEMLSAKVGMSPQHLSEIESGKRDPRLSSIERMAEATGMTVLIVPDALYQTCAAMWPTTVASTPPTPARPLQRPTTLKRLNQIMPKKKPDPAPTQPSVPSSESSSLTFIIETFDDPETGQPTQSGCFSRNWQDEEALNVLINKLEAEQLSHKQALMQARKLDANTPYNLEIQNFIANRLWALGLQDEATEVYERAYKQALAHIPKGFKGQITWSEVDNRPFLRLAHGTLLGLMRRRDKANGGEAATLAKQMLAWCPMDNIGVRFLLGDIALLKGDHQTAMKE
jgi:transcriptional regulator with XRE-family HTH domain